MTYFPVKSMTAYARAKKQFAFGAITVELQSVNRRFLEISCYLPRNFYPLEPSLRKAISQKVGRGMVTLSVKFEQDPSTTVSIRPNLALAKGLKDAWSQIADTIGFSGEIDLNLLASQKELLVNEEKSEDLVGASATLQEVLQEACLSFVEMKVGEGKALQLDILSRLDAIEEIEKKINELAPKVAQMYRMKLQERLEQVLPGCVQEDERILKEIALFADKLDITEELVRLRSHFEKMRHLLTEPLKEQAQVIGKKLEFFLQELTREFNTIGSKASDQQILHLVVEAKAETEKIREQAHNIE